MRRNHFRSQTLTTSVSEISRQFVILSLSTAVLFIIVGLIVMSLGAVLPSSFALRNATVNFESDTIYGLMSNEVPVMRQDVQAKEGNDNVITSALSLLSSINPKDPRSFLGRELPMFKLFDSKIVVAGAGVDYTSIPLESSPPAEVLLQETEATNVPVANTEDDKSVTPLTTNGRKVAFIYHTHNRESYLPHLPKVKNPDLAFHPTTNITLVGEHFGKALTNRGIGNEVSKVDYAAQPEVQGKNYWKSYDVSKDTVVSAMSSNDDIELVFDFHRDARRRAITTAKINGIDYARIMFVIGEGHKNWEQNEAYAKELTAKLDELYPGLSRGIVLKPKTKGTNGVYNQDIVPQALTVEIGGVDNTLEEAYRAASALADAVAALYWKAEKVVSPQTTPAQPQ